MRNIYFIFIMLAILPCGGFAQSANGDQNIYTLSPLLSVTPKIYILNESDLTKYQLPQNYMIVRNRTDNKVILWAFPNEISRIEAPTPVTREVIPKAEKTVPASQEKPKILDETSSFTSEKALETLRTMGLDPKQLNTILSGVEDIKNASPRWSVIGSE